MSRIGKKKVLLEDVKYSLSNNVIVIEGKKGKLSLDLPEEVKVQAEDNALMLSVDAIESDRFRMQGLYRTLIQNMVTGVTIGFKKNLEVVGIGYRIQLRGKNAVFALGYSHEIEVKPPDGIEFLIDGQNKICVLGIDKELVGQVAANIRALRKPDAYKGKGVRYAGELIKTKPGKSVKK